MTYRGVYKDGMVFLEGEVNLRDGERVEVNPSRGSNGSPRTIRTKKVAKNSPRTSAKQPRADDLSALLNKKMTKKERIAAALAMQGTWANRPDFRGKSTVQIANELRKRAAQRGPRG